MAQRKKKKPVNPADVTPPRRPRGRLEPSGRVYEGAVVTRCLVPPVRVAVWRQGAAGRDDEPALCGVLLGIQPHRDGRPPDLRVAVNQHVRAIALGDVGDMCELRSNQAKPTKGDRS